MYENSRQRECVAWRNNGIEGNLSTHISILLCKCFRYSGWCLSTLLTRVWGDIIWSFRTDKQKTHCKKKVNDFPVPSWDVTNQTLPGREYLNYSRSGRVWLVTSRTVRNIVARVYSCIKGKVPRVLDFRFLSWISFPQATTPVVYLHLRISPWIFNKIRNDSNVIFRGRGEMSHEKTWRKKSRDTVPIIHVRKY
jgi:hypothetical protein